LSSVHKLKSSDDKNFISFVRKDVGLRSFEGIRITCSFSINYKVGTQWDNKTALAIEYSNLYKRFGDDSSVWDKLIEVVAQSSFRDTAETFTAFDFFNQRANVSNAMEVGVKVALKSFGFDVT
jgi:hypothetical protein